MNKAEPGTPSSTLGGRSWLRFSVRTLVLLLTASCVGLGVVAWQMKRARDQKVAVDALLGQGAFILYDYQKGNPQAPLTTPKSFREALGDDFFRRATKVSFESLGRGPLAKDDVLQHVGALPYLEELSLHNQAVSTEGLVHVRGLSRLKRLSLSSRSGFVPGNGTGLANISHLRRLQYLQLVNVPLGESRLSFLRHTKQLKGLNLYSTEIRDADLAALESLVDLEEISLNQTSIGDDGLAHLPSLPRLKELRLAFTSISDDGLRDLQRFPSLAVLSLFGTSISDEGVQHLLLLKGLRELRIGQTSVTASGASQLQRELKDCKIEH